MASRLKEVVLNPTAAALYHNSKTEQEKGKGKKKYRDVTTATSKSPAETLAAAVLSSKSKWRREIITDGFKTSLEWEFISALLLKEHCANTSMLRSIAVAASAPPIAVATGMMDGANMNTNVNIQGSSSSDVNSSPTVSDADADADHTTTSQSETTDGMDFRGELTALSAQISMDIMALSIRTNIPVTLIKREYLRYKRRKRSHQQQLKLERKDIDMNMNIGTSSPPPSIPSESCLTGSVNGLPNYGQTCFFNSVIQALATSTPFIRYLERIVFLMEWRQNNEMILMQRSSSSRTSDGLMSSWSQSFFNFRSGEEEQSMCQLLLEVLTYVNCYSSTGMSNSNSGSGNTSSSSAPQIHKKLRQILDRLARNNEQFKSYRSQHSNEQQDSQECLQALMAIVIEESELEKRHQDEDGDEDENDDGDMNGDGEQQQRKRDDRIGHGLGLGSSLFLQDEIYQEKNETLLMNELGIDAPVVDVPEAILNDDDDDDDDDPSSESFSTGSSSQKEEKKEDHDNDDNDGQCQSQGGDNQVINGNGGQDDKLSRPTMEHAHASTPSKIKSNLSKPMQMMIQSLSPKTPSPLNGCVGSRLECCECGHVRPIHDSPFLEIPIVPTAISKYMTMGSGTSQVGVGANANRNSDASCTLVDCLLEFTEEERVQGVNCLACSIKARLRDLAEEEGMLQDAISNITARRLGSKETRVKNVDGDEEISALSEELRVICERIDFLKNVDPDEDLEDVSNNDDDGEDIYNDVLLQLAAETDEIIPKPAKVDVKKRLMVTRLPPVLCLHVKRLYYNPAMDRMAKCLQHIHFSEYLDLRCIYAGEDKGEGHAETDDDDAVAAGEDESPIPYRLMSVIEHRGNAFSGHYLTYRRIDDRNTSIVSSSSWVAVSDQRVSYLNWNDVRKCNAYMLIYEAC